MLRYIITDTMWDRIHTLWPSNCGRPGANNRLFLEAICWVLRTGSPWRELPPDYGDWHATYQRYRYWIRRGKLAPILEELKKTDLITSGTALMRRSSAPIATPLEPLADKNMKR